MHFSARSFDSFILYRRYLDNSISNNIVYSPFFRRVLFL
nr:MAG TPA: NEUROSERPIN, Serine protease inhibitor, Neuronal.06A [Caudoviricetes sp.]